MVRCCCPVGYLVCSAASLQLSLHLPWLQTLARYWRNESRQRVHVTYSFQYEYFCSLSMILYYNYLRLPASYAGLTRGSVQALKYIHNRRSHDTVNRYAE